MLARTVHVVAMALLAPVATGFISGSGSNPKRIPNTPSIRILTADNGSPLCGSSATESESLSTTTNSADMNDVDEKERKANLLDDALRFNSTAASELLDEFSNLRKSGASQEDMERFINGLLEAVDGPVVAESDKAGSVVFPWWTKIRQMARVSRRARLASLRRVLDMSTPSADEKESLGDDPGADNRRRRRSLIVLIRTLANTDNNDEEEGDTAVSDKVSRRRWTPAISVLESAARKDLKASFKAQDMESRLPPGLETPNYSVLARRKGYEIRRYEPFSVCSVGMNKPRPVDSSRTDAKISNPQLAGARAFGALAGYLFGKNQQETSMKMTTPVLSEGQGEEKTMAFVLPSEFWKNDGIQNAPRPLSGSGVELARKEPGEIAVVMFGGFASKRDVDAREKELLGALAKDGDWVVKNGNNVTLAQYNDPFTPPWKRRNEVSIRVVPKET